MTATSRSWHGAGAAVIATGFGGAVPIPLLLRFRDELALTDAKLSLAFRDHGGRHRRRTASRRSAL